MNDPKLRVPCLQAKPVALIADKQFRSAFAEKTRDLLGLFLSARKIRKFKVAPGACGGRADSLCAARMPYPTEEG